MVFTKGETVSGARCLIRLLVALWPTLTLLYIVSCTTATNTPVLLPTTPDPVVLTGEYQIQVGDSLDIKFFYHPELDESVIVRPDGRISLQLIHETQAAGLSPEKLRNTLLEKYATAIVKPEIAVIVRSFTAQKVYVDGEVTRPGMVPLAGPMTVLQSIASAGGLKDTADSGEIVVIRRGAENRPLTFLISLENAIKGTDPTQDISLLPADIVYVPKTTIANINVWVDQYIRQNVPIPFSIYYSVK